MLKNAAPKPPKTSETGYRPPSALNLMFAALGIAFLLATFFPFGAQVLETATGGIHGPFFKMSSPAIYLLLNFVANYLPIAVLIGLLFRQFKILDRVPNRYRGDWLFTLGVWLFLTYSVARILAATIEGGGMGFVVRSFAPVLLLPALGLFFVAVIRLCIGLFKGMD